MKRDIITGLDIGTSKVCAVIAEIKEKRKLKILGAGLSPCSGISKGMVSNLDKVTDSIAAALGQAEEKAKLKTRTSIKAHAVIANVGGPSVKGKSYEGAISVSSLPREITRRDVKKVIDITKDLSISLEEDPIHLIPFVYTLDNQTGIENPLGLYGVKLKARLYIITCATNLIRNITKAINHAGYETKDIVYSGMADSYILSDEEKSDGVALIDMGSDVTELVVYAGGKIRFNLALDLGSADLTEAISLQFKIPKKVAEDLKIRYGTIYEQDLNIDERITVDVEQKRVSIDRSSMNYLICSKIKEIFNSLKKGLNDSGFQNHLPAGVVMSGAPLLMSGVIETAEREFSLPVRMGAASGITEDSYIASDPTYTTSIGLVKHGLNELIHSGRSGFRKENFIEKAICQLKEILTDYF